MSSNPNDPIDRRDLLGASALAAATLAADHLFAAAPKVEDGASSIKITSTRGFRVGTKTYVKIETNHKITGWGEVSGLDPTVCVALIASLAELLDGENPTRIEHLWQKVYRSHRDMRGGPFMTHTLGGIDMALWDISGKVWNTPVYRLLGGPTRNRIRMYNTTKAQKTGTGGPHPWSGNERDVRELVKRIQDSRK